ncbi:MAG: ComEC family competence protein [Saprospiraceae bacterium]|nr:ComEC family competence protein [Saprospiraceae bacterium]
MRFSIVLISGVCFASWNEHIDLAIALSLLVGSSLAAVTFHRSSHHRWTAIFAGLSLLSSVFWLGCYVFLAQLPGNDGNHLIHFIQDRNEVYFKVSEVGNRRVLADVVRLNGNEAGGHLVLYGDDLSETISVGDLMFSCSRIRTINPPHNPGAFNYQRYFKGKQIYHQAYLNEPPMLLATDQDMPWHRYPRKWRAALNLALVARIENPDALALCQALLLGDKSMLPEDLKDAFVDAGTMHILAVSGLHLGIIYLILRTLFSFIGLRTGVPKVIRSVLIILCLWSFALMVGGAASVVRAATMFSLFEFSRVIFRKNYALNSLSLAALGLVLVDPMSIYDIGFQLSFMALLGILICQKPIEQICLVENRWLYKIWQMVSLSLAAQLFTFPLSIYYFNEFPIFFWLSGVVAIPLAFLLLAAGIGFFALSFIPILGAILAFLLSHIALLLNGWIYLIQQIPGVSIERIHIDIYQVALLLVCGCLLSLLLIRKQSIYLIYVLTAVVGCQIYDGVKKIQLATQMEFVAYSLSHKSHADLFMGRQVYSLHPKDTNTELHYDVARYRYARQATPISSQSENDQFMNLAGFIKVGDWTCHVVDRSEFRLTDYFPKVDLLWLQTPVELDEQMHLLRYRVGEVLLDRSLPYGYIRHINQLAHQQDLAIHEMRVDGAYRKVIQP